MKKILTSILLTICMAAAWAQRSEPVRIEINTKPDSDIFNVIPVDEEGVLIFYKSVAAFDQMHTIWVFTLFDKKLSQVWTKEIPILSEARYNAFSLRNHQLHMVFYNEENVKKDETNLQLLRYDLQVQNFTSLYGVIAEKSEFIDFEVWNDRVFLGFNERKYEVGLYSADFSTSAFNNIDVSLNEKNLLEDLYFDKHNNNLAVIINHYISKKESYLLINYYNYDGNITQNTAVRSENPDISMSAAKMISLSKNNKLIIGAYNNQAAQSSSLKEEETIAAGIFSSKISNGQAGRVNLYNFIDFRNFSSYMQVPRLMKYKRKGKDNPERDYSLNYRLLPHDIIMQDSQFVFLTEAYYPEYRTVSYISYDYYGRPYPQTYTVFDGYKYFGGIVTAFNKSGELLWENGIKIWDIQSFRLQKKVEAFFDNSDLILAYNSGGKIGSEIFSRGATVGDFEYADLETKYRKDRVTSDWGSNIEEWYGKYFLCYGYQEIRNNALADENKRTVFYMNKIAFD